LHTFLGRSSICKRVDGLAKLHVGVVSGESHPQLVNILLVVAKLRLEIGQQLDFEESFARDKPVSGASTGPETKLNIEIRKNVLMLY